MSVALSKFTLSNLNAKADPSANATNDSKDSKETKQHEHKEHELVIDLGPGNSNKSSTHFPMNGTSIWTDKDEQTTIAGTMHGASSPHINGLLHAVHHAFANETNLVLRPDDFQLAIIQFVSKHVATDPIKYGPIMGVDHKGKTTLEVVHNQLSVSDPKDVATPKWAEVFPMFEKSMNKACTETPVLKALSLCFSTTTPTDKVVRRVALMKAYESYFNYVVRTRCGIQKVILKGTPSDWQAIADSLSAYDALDLGWWTLPARHVLNRIVASYKTVDVSFWKSLYKYQAASGTSHADGWMLLFLLDPTRHATKLCPAASWPKDQYLEPLKITEFASGLSMVPFVWKYFLQVKQMTFLSGFSRPHFDKATDNTTVTTQWAVQDNSKSF